MADYGIGAAFKAIEDELMASMIRNMDRHRAEEDKEGYNWSMWQAEQLKALEKYKKQNQKKYSKQFSSINSKVEAIIYNARVTGNLSQEVSILEAIKNGFKGVNKVSKGMTAEFFRLNDRKLDALVKATTQDMAQAETAVLRMANDQYRKAIFNAQVYVNSGAGTYEKAVDMATKDMLSRGLNCIEYANGARHTLSDYADMALRTASKRAYLQGEGEKRQEWGISTVIMVKRGNPCPKCLPFVGKVLTDDVWSGGKQSDGPYLMMSKAIVAGLYHPRCKDSHTTYFPDISTADDAWTQEELDAVNNRNRKEAKKHYADRQAERFGRLAEYSLDEENVRKYEEKVSSWKTVAKSNGSGIIKEPVTEEEPQVHTVGKIDKDIYKSITDDIVTDEVIITDRQIEHIKERHPNDYERYQQYLGDIVADPDYIIETSKPKTALVLKEIIDADNEVFKTVVRLATSGDDPEYKNSIITFMKIDEKEWQRLLRNKKILYKKE